MILTSVAVGLIASAMFMIPRTETAGAKTLLAIVAYQQLMYGRHSAITAGNLGFLIRNACLAGTLGLFLTVPKKVPEPGLPGAVARVRKSMRDNCALAVRVLFGLAVLEMFDVVGWGWAFVMIPDCGCATVRVPGGDLRVGAYGLLCGGGLRGEPVLDDSCDEY